MTLDNTFCSTERFAQPLLLQNTKSHAKTQYYKMTHGCMVRYKIKGPNPSIWKKPGGIYSYYKMYCTTSNMPLSKHQEKCSLQNVAALSFVSSALPPRKLVVLNVHSLPPQLASKGTAGGLPNRLLELLGASSHAHRDSYGISNSAFPSALPMPELEEATVTRKP